MSFSNFSFHVIIEKKLFSLVDIPQGIQTNKFLSTTEHVERNEICFLFTLVSMIYKSSFVSHEPRIDWPFRTSKIIERLVFFNCLSDIPHLLINNFATINGYQRAFFDFIISICSKPSSWNLRLFDFDSLWAPSKNLIIDAHVPLMAIFPWKTIMTNPRNTLHFILIAITFSSLAIILPFTQTSNQHQSTIASTLTFG